jgi:hypothetical protein
MSQAPQKPKPEEVVGVVPELTTWLWGGPPSECMEAIELLELDRVKLEKVILLNAFVVPRKPMVIITMPTNIENVKALIRKVGKIESYVGHESTARLLSELLETPVPYNRSEYQPVAGDIAVIVKLKKRLEKPEDVKNVKPEDLEFYIVNYNNSWVLGYDD